MNKCGIGRDKVSYYYIRQHYRPNIFASIDPVQLDFDQIRHPNNERFDPFKKGFLDGLELDRIVAIKYVGLCDY